MNKVNFWTSGPTLPMQWLGWTALTVAIALLGLLAVAYFRRTVRRLEPLAVFRRIACGLDLSVPQQWRLMHIARQQKLSSPLTLLLSPATFNHHAEHYLQQIKPRRVAPLRTQLDQLRQHIYGE